MFMKTRESKPTRSDAVKIYEWCKKTYGRSKINGPYPTLQFRKPNYLTGDVYGYYEPDDRVLFVSNTKNETIIDLVDTIIHEWTHYHQPLKSHSRKMIKEGRMHELFEENDPLEIQAEEVAQRDSEKCFNELFS